MRFNQSFQLAVVGGNNKFNLCAAHGSLFFHVGGFESIKKVLLSNNGVLLHHMSSKMTS